MVIFLMRIFRKGMVKKKTKKQLTKLPLISLTGHIDDTQAPKEKLQ